MATSHCATWPEEGKPLLCFHGIAPTYAGIQPFLLRETFASATENEMSHERMEALHFSNTEIFVVLYRNFRSLPFFGFIGFLNKAAKGLIYSYPPECSQEMSCDSAWMARRSIYMHRPRGLNPRS